MCLVNNANVTDVELSCEADKQRPQMLLLVALLDFSCSRFISQLLLRRIAVVEEEVTAAEAK